MGRKEKTGQHSEGYNNLFSPSHTIPTPVQSIIMFCECYLLNISYTYTYIHSYSNTEIQNTKILLCQKILIRIVPRIHFSEHKPLNPRTEPVSAQLKVHFQYLVFMKYLTEIVSLCNAIYAISK